MERFQNIGIYYNSNGITVKVGCITLVYQQTQLNMFHDDLASYLNDPKKTADEVRKRWHIEQGEDSEAPEEATEERAPAYRRPSQIGSIRRDEARVDTIKEAESPR